MTRPPDPLRWNDRTTLRLVQFDYELKATARAVRLTGGAARVGDVVRVGISGVEVEGRITGIEGSSLRVALSPDVPAVVRRATPASMPQTEERGTKKRMAKASPRAKEKQRQTG